MCPRSRSAPTFSLRSPNSAPTFSLLVPTLPGAPKPARLPPPSPGLWKQPQILSEGSPCGREDKSRGPNPPSHRQTPLGKVLPLSRKRNPGGCGQGQGRWGGGWRQTEDIPLLCTLPWEGMGLGILGSCPKPIPSSSTVPSTTPGSPFFYPTQPSPAAIEDSAPSPGGPWIKVPSPLWLPSIPAPHLPRGSGKLPSS